LVTALSVNVGSSAGGTQIKIVGSNLDRGSSVTFDNRTVTSNGYDPRDAPGTSLLITTPAHPTGVVDVIVRNGDRGTTRLTGAYEFVDQESFDVNGNWSGVTIDGTDTFVQFVIRNNVLISASCDGAGKSSVALSTEALNGAFSAESSDGFRLFGRMVSTAESTGRLLARACFDGETVWYAHKVG